MNSILVIAEKPSVSQALAKVLGAYKREDGYMEGNGYIVSWCLGHLAEYAPPDAYGSQYKKWNYEDLPIIPQEWKLDVAEEKKEQFDLLSSLLNRMDISYVVNACDAGREGELIFMRVYELSGSHVPVKRLWISSMEDSAIQEGFRELKDGSEYAALYDASVCRAKADWLVGMNATRAFTTKYNRRLTVGRVQTPTLSMLVERQKQIDGFEKTAYYKVRIEGNGITAVSENYADKVEADAVAKRCDGTVALVTKVERKRKKSQPPKLYDLTTLQREANRIFGYTAQETLQELQKLYEDKLVTYPRTDSQFVTEDMADTVQELLGGLPEVLPFLKDSMEVVDIGRVINNAKVTDHHAILPTKAALNEDLSELTAKQRNLFSLIGQRLAQAVAGESVSDETSVILKCAGYEFQAKGNRMVVEGYKTIEKAFAAVVKAGKGANKADGENGEDKNVLSSGIDEDMVIPSVSAKSEQHFTSPPKPYTEDTLLSAMETAGNKEFDAETEKKGLGTPATRASMIEKLVSSGYAVRKGRQITPTTAGMKLIEILPDYLKSASMTAEWENQLLGIEKGEVESTRFLQGITNLIKMVLHGCDTISEEELAQFDTREKIGDCPVCGKPVYEGKQNFYCSDRECRFTLWKENRYLSGLRKTVDKKMAADLLSKGRTHVKDFYSAKKDTTFEADLLMKVEDGRASFSLFFPKSKGRGKKKK
ncbi:MAG: DNA topoisomerase 3 [Lachnospiraceae bacterium]|nr:DNA topoisomerase 3 [Lachnospiraceae bacterium]